MTNKRSESEISVERYNTAGHPFVLARQAAERDTTPVGDLARRVIWSGEENAADTAACGDVVSDTVEYFDIAQGSLLGAIESLDYHDTDLVPALLGWFRSHGVRI